MEFKESLIEKMLEANSKVDQRLEEALNRSASQNEFHRSLKALRSELPDEADEEIFLRINQQRREEIARLVVLSAYCEVQIADINEGLVSY